MKIKAKIHDSHNIQTRVNIFRLLVSFEVEYGSV